MKFVSIIIPVYKDWDRLKICLASLSDQTYPETSFEIIIINNCAPENIPSGIQLPSNVSLFTEEKPGSYCARNKGIRHAKGEIIGFIDSDCIADKEWIENAVALFAERSEFLRIAGKIELFYNSSEPNAAELYEKVYAFKQDFAASRGMSVTGNMFVFTWLFEKAGLFDETLMSGADSEWSLRAQKLGYKIVYGVDVIVKHPARNEVGELVRKSKRVANFYGRNRLISLLRAAKNSLPPILSFSKSVGLTISQKITVFRLRYFLNLVRSVEEIKISFGKMPNRT